MTTKKTKKATTKNKTDALLRNRYPTKQEKLSGFYHAEARS